MSDSDSEISDPERPASGKRLRPSSAPGQGSSPSVTPPRRKLLRPYIADAASDDDEVSDDEEEGEEDADEKGNLKGFIADDDEEEEDGSHDAHRALHLAQATKKLLPLESFFAYLGTSVRESA